MNIISEIWNLKLQILPIVISIAIFELPAIIRRWKKLFYVPIYFSVFPLREINEDLSTFLMEDYFIGLGERITKVQAEKLRKKIILISIISMLIGALLTPLAVGFASAFYMSKVVFYQFIAILLLYKFVLLSKSIFQFHLHAISSKRNYFLLGLIYICYLGVVFEVLRSSYNWTIPYIQSKQWGNLLSDLSSLVFGKAIIGILILSLITALFVTLITERGMKEREL